MLVSSMDRKQCISQQHSGLPNRKKLFEELGISNADLLIDGFWVVDRPLVCEGGVMFNCPACFCYFEDRMSYELHMQGSKHKENKRQCSVANESRSSNHSVKHLTKLEILVRESNEPLLGLNYLTEFLHRNGRYDCVCNLCGSSSHSAPEARLHITSSNHILNFMYQHSRALYNALQLNKMDMYMMRDGAKKLEEDMNEKNKRTKIIEELGNVWVEYRHDDDSTSCTNSLKGHQLNGRYDEPLPPINSQKYEEQHRNSVDQLTKDVEHLFILSNDLPPNYHLKNFNRSLFLDLLGRMTIKSNADADLCLRLANSLTLSLLKYRMRSINNLKTVNTDELKGKIEGLIDDATSVSEKLLQKKISFT